MNLEPLLEQAGSSRPGYEVASFKEAGLPVYLLTVRVLTLEKRPLGPIDEAVLKSLEAGLDNPEDLTAFLGLSLSVLTPVLARLNTSELINYILGVGASRPVVSTTIKGRAALSAVATITPQERTVKVCLDALTRRLLFIHPNQLFKPRDMREQGWFEVPTGSAKRIEVDDIPVQEFDKVLNRGNRQGEAHGELLSVRRIERRELHYLPCVMMFYRHLNQKDDISVAFWREDGPSLEHEKQFREVDGPNLVGAKLLGSGAPDVSTNAVSDVVEQVARLHGYSEPSAPLQTPASSSQPLISTAMETLQSIKCHEHPSWLKKGLLSSKKRLLIISPWIRHHVVDWQFVASLDALLRNRVSVYIGYGLSDGDGGARNNPGQQKPPITPQAEADLKKLAGQYSNFRFVYVGNTHQKTLISDDDFAIVTSFNWLSFRGDPKDKPRDERGVVIRKKEYVDKQFTDALSLLDNGYSGPDDGGRKLVRQRK